jgi:hypothetical protein
MTHKLTPQRSHDSPGSVEWYTPPELFEALGLTFDLDAAAPAGGLDWIPAEPYGRTIGPWIRRLAAHGDGVALVFARTDTVWFHETILSADCLCFVKGRVNFIPPEPRTASNGTATNSGVPSMLLAYGEECALAVAESGLGLTFAVGGSAIAGQPCLWEGKSRASGGGAPPMDGQVTVFDVLEGDAA